MFFCQWFLSSIDLGIGDLSANHFFSKPVAYYKRKSSSLNIFFRKKTEEPQKGPKPQNWSIQRDKSKSSGYIFVGAMVSLVLNNRSSKNDHRKIYLKDLDSRCRELSNSGLGIVVHNPSGSLAT